MPTTRPTRWLTRRRVLWSACCALVLFLAWQAYDIVTGKQQPNIDYATQFFELCSSAQGEGANAWPLLVRVLERVEEAELQLELDPMATQYDRDGNTWPGTFDDLLYRRLGAPDLQPHLRLLRTLRDEGTFNRLNDLAAMTRCVRPRVDEVPFHDAYFSTTMKHNARVRRLGRMQAGRLLTAAGSWNWAELAEVTDQSLSVFQLVSRQPSLIEFMVGAACAEAVLRELRTTLVERPLGERSARALLQIIDASTDWPAPEHTMAGEHLLRLDNIQNEYTASGRMPLSTFGRYSRSVAASGASSTALMKVAALEIGAIVFPGREAAERLDAKYTEDIVRIATSTDQTFREELDHRWSEKIPGSQFVLRRTTLPPALIAGGWHSLHQSIESTRLMLAIEIYIAREGRAPTSLDDLAPDILPEIPLDPLNGQTWGYRRLSQTSGGTTYLLWSFGEDGENNNCKEDDGRMGLHAQPGTDIWINKPRYIPQGLMQ